MEHSISPGDMELVKALNGGSESAFNKLFYAWHERLYLYCFRMVKSKELADEIVQETFIRLWRSRESLDPTLPLNSWLFTTSYHLLIDQLRKIAADRSLHKQLMEQMASFHNNTMESVLYADLYQLTSKALHNMPEQQRQVFILSRQQGLSHAEIAIKLNISPNTVKVHLSRALKWMRQYLQAEGDLALLFLLLIYTDKFSA